MTYLITDGQYLIADKRSSFTIGMVTASNKNKAGGTRKRTRRDDAVKIITYTDAFYKENRVVAGAFSGTYSSPGAHLLNILTTMKDLDMMVKLITDGAIKPESAGVLFCLDDGSFLSLKGSYNENGIKYTFQKAAAGSFKNRILLSDGGGAHYSHLLNPLYEDGKITLLDAFFFGAHFSDSCTTDYSVYGVEENHLFTTVQPSAETVKESIDKVLGLLAFTELKKSYFP